MEIQVLKKQGRSIRQIARETGLSRNTVRRYLRERRAMGYGPREARPCKLDRYKAFLQDWRVFEDQQMSIDRDSDSPTVDINADAGPIACRNVLDRMLAEEGASRHAAAAE